MKIQISKIGLLVGLVLSTSAWAKVTVIQDSDNEIRLKVTESYTLGGNDTLSNAENLVIEQAKRAATDYAGTYVESELNLSNNQITKQQVRVLSAGFMEVSRRDFNHSVNKSGNFVLHTEAEIKLSKKSITDGINKLKSDPERKAKINNLEKQNKHLRNELLQLSKKINSSNSSRTDLMAAREKVLAELDNNREAAKQVFEEGTLFQLAMLDNSDYELAKKDIDENVFGYFIHETKISMGKPRFVKNKSGNYDISIPVQWNLRKSSAQKVLEKHFKITSKFQNGHMGTYVPYAIGVSSYNNRGDDAKKQYTENLFKYMKSKSLVIEVGSGSNYGYLPISANTGGMGNGTYGFQFSNDSKNNTMLKGYLYRNPVIIKNVTEVQLRSMTSLTAKVVLLDENKVRNLRYD
ncbi:hypothetical protein [Vibrio marisflavi]|uniref:Uncharacterized protein n=1 Tax=Vibrio marisflavi CECT 7928 TaxID=634439 RepID=A0ABM9ABE8_9VIBR|nr:hypothetical protein [Vibrio marisflavi]CAH0543220.1 hypothetical protein VMF7928_04477 [Vibrio marisflavi CECT 7928]